MTRITTKDKHRSALLDLHEKAQEAIAYENQMLLLLEDIESKYPNPNPRNHVILKIEELIKIHIYIIHDIENHHLYPKKQTQKTPDDAA